MLRMTGWVKMRRTRIEHILSALPPLATEEWTFGIGSSVPEKRRMHRSKQHHDDHLVGESRAASTELQTECPGGLSVPPEQALGPLGKRTRR
jgi:hypothetical protein